MRTDAKRDTPHGAHFGLRSLLLGALLELGGVCLLGKLLMLLAALAFGHGVHSLALRYQRRLHFGHVRVALDLRGRRSVRQGADSGPNRNQGLHSHHLRKIIGWPTKRHLVMQKLLEALLGVLQGALVKGGLPLEVVVGVG